MILRPCTLEEFEAEVSQVDIDERNELGMQYYLSTRYDKFGATCGPLSGLNLYNRPDELTEEEFFSIIDAVRPDFTSDFVPDESLEGNFEVLSMNEHPDNKKFTMPDAFFQMFLILIIGVAIAMWILK